MNEASANALVGTILDRRYRLHALVGPGEKGAWIFRAHELDTGTSVAVRCPGVPPELSGRDYERALATFRDEAELLARASQTEAGEDIERLLAYGIAQPAMLARLPYCVFEWLEGKSLEQHIVERAGAVLSVGEALTILEPAARALTAMHDLGIAHRDVRPKNLWLSTVGGRTRLKLTHFVLASRIGSSADAFAPEYGAPEHFKRSYGVVGPPADVYGLALSFVELVSGRRALEGRDAGELYLATSNLTTRPTLRARGVQASDSVEAAVARALAVDPKRRWQNAREFWGALASAVPELPPLPLQSDGSASSDATGEGRASGASPSIWPSGDGRPSVVTPSDDARLSLAPANEGALPRATPSPRPPRRGRSMQLALGALAVIALGVGGWQLRQRVTDASKSTSSEPTTVSTTASSRDDALAALGHAGWDAAATDPDASDEGASAQDASARDASDGDSATPFSDMVLVSPGTFTMGTNRGGRGDGPAHSVTLSSAFYIDRTEVTAEKYAACVEDGACSPNRVHTGAAIETSWGCNDGKSKPRHPVNCVDREQAERFCAYAHKRLPTEAEWEYAARGADEREYPWGSSPPTTCATAIVTGLSGDCRARKGTAEVGQAIEGQSPFGVLDMAGNVWEWVMDAYVPYGRASVTDPKTPLASARGKGILRGGSWDYAPTSAKATYRYPFQANVGNVSTGFRCARDVTE